MYVYIYKTFISTFILGAFAYIFKIDAKIFSSCLLLISCWVSLISLCHLYLSADLTAVWLINQWALSPLSHLQLEIIYETHVCEGGWTHWVSNATISLCRGLRSWKFYHGLLIVSSLRHFWLTSLIVQTFPVPLPWRGSWSGGVFWPRIRNKE